MCFVFGYKVVLSLKFKVGGIIDDDYEVLVWEIEWVLKIKLCKKFVCVREVIVCECGYFN